MSCLASCSQVIIHDDPWCADAGKFGAECFHTISDISYSLNKFQWDKLRVGQICTASEEPGRGYSNLKQAILKLCADSNLCSAQALKQLDKFDSKLEAAKDRAVSK